LDEQQAETVLDAADGNLPVALVMSKTGQSREKAVSALEESRGVIADAVNALTLP